VPWRVLWQASSVLIRPCRSVREWLTRFERLGDAGFGSGVNCRSASREITRWPSRPQAQAGVAEWRAIKQSNGEDEQAVTRMSLDGRIECSRNLSRDEPPTILALAREVYPDEAALRKRNPLVVAA
jgi:hypothetical protein